MNNEEELPQEVLDVLKGEKLEEMAMKVVYKNYRGEKSIRHVLPLRIWYGSTEWHKKEQWLMEVYDLEKRSKRDYALKDWRGAPED